MLEDCALPLHLEAKVRLDFRARPDWDRETRRLRNQLARPAPVDPPVPCPYPGMRAFAAGDARCFHGRDAEIDAVIARLEAGEREVYLIGPSGSGQVVADRGRRAAAARAARRAASSWCATLRLGDAPLARLADCLEAAWRAAPPATAVAAWAARHPGARLIVFIDQLEELFT